MERKFSAGEPSRHLAAGEPLSSYQMRLRNIEFARQRQEDLEQIIFMLADQIVELGAQPRLMLGNGIVGERYINDISSGEFAMRVFTHIAREKPCMNPTKSVSKPRSKPRASRRRD